MSHTDSATSVQLVKAFVLGGLDCLPALVTDGSEWDMGNGGVGLNNEAVDNDDFRVCDYGGRGGHHVVEH